MIKPFIWSAVIIKKQSRSYRLKDKQIFIDFQSLHHVFCRIIRYYPSFVVKHQTFWYNPLYHWTITGTMRRTLLTVTKFYKLLYLSNLSRVVSFHHFLHNQNETAIALGCTSVHILKFKCIDCRLRFYSLSLRNTSQKGMINIYDRWPFSFLLGIISPLSMIDYENYKRYILYTAGCFQWVWIVQLQHSLLHMKNANFIWSIIK